jgi:hypothetical protein
MDKSPDEMARGTIASSRRIPHMGCGAGRFLSSTEQEMKRKTQAMLS